MLFNKRTEYSIQVLMFLSGEENNSYISASEIALKIGLPKEFLSKILQSLTHVGIVYSQKGKNGGFRLNKLAEEIGLIDLINLFEDEDFFSKCILGLHANCKTCICPIHSGWEEVKKEFTNIRITDIKKKLTNNQTKNS